MRRLLAVAAVLSASAAATAAPFEDTIAQRVLACTGCHGAAGRAADDGYYPRIAGKPASYLHNQLLNFRDGRRDYVLMTNLLAPLTDAAGVAEWPIDDVMRLLKTGVSNRGVVTGPMVEVVLNSTQHLSDADLHAVATYLRSLRPSRLQADAPGPGPTGAPPSGRGAALYRDHCAGCHGDGGEGVAGAYPALAGNRAVTMSPVANLVHIVREGGFPPATAGNPRPFGMPPFATVLSDEDIAQLLSFLRTSWGNRAAPVTPLQVLTARSGGR